MTKISNFTSVTYDKYSNLSLIQWFQNFSESATIEYLKPPSKPQIWMYIRGPPQQISWTNSGPQIAALNDDVIFGRPGYEKVPTCRKFLVALKNTDKLQLLDRQQTII